MTRLLLLASSALLLVVVLVARLVSAPPGITAEAAPVAQATHATQVAPVGVLQSAPSLTPAQIDAILSSAGSPAAGTGRAFYDLGIAYGIDPAYALAFFQHESGFGTNPSWDGLKPDGSTTHDIGNISCAGYPTCYGRWRDYPDWRTGIEDWYRLIRDEYIGGRGFTTVDQVIPVYAPAIENDVAGYQNAVSATVAQWRQAYPQTAATQPPQGAADDDTPNGCPLGTSNVIITQGYGVGSHAPADTWGAIDLAIDGDGDGLADPGGTLGAPIYATHAGVVHLAIDTWPAGNHIWIEGAHYQTGYSHLKGFAVQDGQHVSRGDVIGYVGSTGQSSGPHLDYQVWKDGVNVNPLDYGATP